jgi:hypothetical protein
MLMLSAVCNRHVNQGILKNRESENSAVASGAGGEFQVKYSSFDVKQANWRKMVNAAGGVA